MCIMGHNTGNYEVKVNFYTPNCLSYWGMVCGQHIMYIHSHDRVTKKNGKEEIDGCKVVGIVDTGKVEEGTGLPVVSEGEETGFSSVMQEGAVPSPKECLKQL